MERKKATVVIAEHRLKYLIDVADRFVYMKDGKVHSVFSCAEFKALSNSILRSSQYIGHIFGIFFLKNIKN